METAGNILKNRNIIFVGGDVLTSGGGFTQVPNFILTSKKIGVGAKLTYAMLLKYAWQNDYCFPGQETLAKDMGTSLRSVTNFIKELSEADYIDVQRQGLGKPNIYTLNLVVKKMRH